MIHYHGLPMTPLADMVRALTARHAMVSFEHPSQAEMAAEVCQSFVLDNGAFSAWKQGKAYDFGGYQEWAERWMRHPAMDWCVIPDRIDGSESDNRELVKNWPLPPAVSVPVWHMHESLEYLDFLMRWPRIALGSSGQFATVGDDRWWGRIAEAMRVLCDEAGRPKVKLHGLRMLDPGVFSKLPLSSADSCNVARNAGIDQKWRGPYTPRTQYGRALILMERIEHHASCAYWSADAMGAYTNLELFG
jgi:hypothetical protein